MGAWFIFAKLSFGAKSGMLDVHEVRSYRIQGQNGPFSLRCEVNSRLIITASGQDLDVGIPGSSHLKSLWILGLQWMTLWHGYTPVTNKAITDLRSHVYPTRIICDSRPKEYNEKLTATLEHLAMRCFSYIDPQRGGSWVIVNLYYGSFGHSIVITVDIQSLAMYKFQ